MDRSQAEDIANLLNEQNELTVQYTANMVLDHQDNYLIRTDDSGQVIACAELKKVQWYQFELLHVTVAQDHQKKGYARSLISEAMKLAIKKHARILQCTIRADNVASQTLFESLGFESVSRFYNVQSKQTINVRQLVLSAAPATEPLKV